MEGSAEACLIGQLIINGGPKSRQGRIVSLVTTKDVSILGWAVHYYLLWE